MVKNIKIVNHKNEEIKPDNDDLVVIKINGRTEYVNEYQAENIERFIKSQLNILKGRKKVDRRTGHTEDKIYNKG